MSLVHAANHPKNLTFSYSYKVAVNIPLCYFVLKKKKKVSRRNTAVESGGGDCRGSKAAGAEGRGAQLRGLPAPRPGHPAARSARHSPAETAEERGGACLLPQPSSCCAAGQFTAASAPVVKRCSCARLLALADEHF